MTAQELSGVFCEDLVAQELDNDTAFFEIPEEMSDYIPTDEELEVYRKKLPKVD